MGINEKAGEVFSVAAENSPVADTTEANKDSVQSAIDGCPVSAISQGE